MIFSPQKVKASVIRILEEKDKKGRPTNIVVTMSLSNGTKSWTVSRGLKEFDQYIAKCRRLSLQAGRSKTRLSEFTNILINFEELLRVLRKLPLQRP